MTSLQQRSRPGQDQPIAKIPWNPHERQIVSDTDLLEQRRAA